MFVFFNTLDAVLLLFEKDVLDTLYKTPKCPHEAYKYVNDKLLAQCSSPPVFYVSCLV